MAKNRSTIEEAVEVTSRRITPPPQEELSEPDTSELPPARVAGTVAAEPLAAEARNTRQPYYTNETGDIEEAIDANEKWYTVKPNTTFDTIIGHNRWYFKKDTLVKVPESVRQILANAKKIYP